MVMLCICAKFPEIILNGIKVMERTRMINGWRRDGRTDGQIDTQKFGGYNIIPRHFLRRGIIKMFQKALFLLKEKITVQNYFEIHAEMQKLWPGQIWTYASTMHTRTHIHRREVVTTMSPSPQAGLTIKKLSWNHRIMHGGVFWRFKENALLHKIISWGHCIMYGGQNSYFPLKIICMFLTMPCRMHDFRLKNSPPFSLAPRIHSWKSACISMLLQSSSSEHASDFTHWVYLCYISDDRKAFHWLT